MEGGSKKPGRSARLVQLVSVLTERPGRALALTDMASELGVAKSTLSEDIAQLDAIFRSLGRGVIESRLGPSGGVTYYPLLSAQRIEQLLGRLAAELSQPQRIVQGGFLYLSDIAFSPEWVVPIGEVFATLFRPLHPQAVVSVETKGIPLALMTARALGIPLAVARRQTGVTEGPALGLNYLSATARRLGTMSLARRALPEGARVILVDDFLKGGGTLKGLFEMMKEFSAEVVGTGVLIETDQPKEKLIGDYTALLRLEHTEGGTGGDQVSLAPGLTAVLSGGMLP